MTLSDIREYLKVRNGHILESKMDEGFFPAEELKYFQEHLFKSEEDKSFYIKEMFFMRNMFCHQLEEYKDHQVIPLSNDVTYDQSFVVSSIIVLLTGYNLFHDHRTKVADILNQMCKHLNFRPEAIETLSAMEAVQSILCLRNQEDNYVAYQQNQEEIESLYAMVKEDATILFMHAIVYMMNRCPFAKTATPEAFSALVACCKKAIESMLPLLKLDCAGMLGTQLIQRFHDCDSKDSFEEFTSSCRFFLQFLTDAEESIVPWCSLQDNPNRIMTVVEASLRFLDDEDVELSILSTSEMILHLYVHLRWLRLVGKSWKCTSWITTR